MWLHASEKGYEKALKSALLEGSWGEVSKKVSGSVLSEDEEGLPSPPNLLQTDLSFWRISYITDTDPLNPRELMKMTDTDSSSLRGERAHQNNRSARPGISKEPILQLF